jgi:starch synthase
MSWNKAALMPKYEEDSWGLLDWDDRINPMAAAIKCCWTYTTVSQGYLHEICSQAVLGPLLYAERKKSYGILNGIDINVWDPSVDKLIDVQFTEATLVSGKTKNKKNFCKLFKLPLFGFIGRFAIEKGADLLPEFIQRMNEGDGKKINIVVLGSGNPKIEEALRKTQSEYSDTFALVIGYDEPLAHKLYASADFLMMPSRVEPCGLNQLYAMRYGAIPIVRQTGGLGDTVQDISDENGNGFVFPLASIEDLTAAIDRATAFYYDNPTAMHDLMKHNMMLDHSWDKSVDKYHDLYRRLLDK